MSREALGFRASRATNWAAPDAAGPSPGGPSRAGRPITGFRLKGSQANVGLGALRELFGDVHNAGIVRLRFSVAVAAGGD